MKVRDLIRRLEKEGWYISRIRGSHRQFRHPRRRGTITVAGKPSGDMPIGTLHEILRKSGLNK
ncbi:MAG: type II toxin-antitoxin system HicA family toxin [Pseudohongiella sp.]|nr:type II toxin-antitoxin system HicA family toxin [Pseudohongiella sp.]